MYCQECGTENREGARFCSNCGSELRSRGIVCPGCHADNPRDSRLCANCGAEFGLPQVTGQARPRSGEVEPTFRPQSKRPKRKVRIGHQWHPAVVVLVLLAGGLLVVLAFENIFSPESPRKQLVEQKSSDAVLEANVIEVASKFVCACGACGEQPLDTCTCNAAIQERQFIRNYLLNGQTVEQVIVAVKDNFGWMKAEFAPKYGGLSSQPTIPSEISPGFDQLASKAIGTNSRLATWSDRTEIFSYFECPCGQCGINELRDCGCDHPRGATEVKAFVDEKIQADELTVAEIVEIVEVEYGHRKDKI